MRNPFEDPEATYLVLINHEGQHSLWPSTVEVPAGWSVALQPTSRQDCLAYVNEHWVDMRPVSLRHEMDPDVGRADA